MPSATRNTNTNSGNEVSAPPNPNTWLKKKALTPRAAAKDSTTVAVRISGATSARSSSARMMNTTTRMSGMMMLRSCADARLHVQVDRGVAAHLGAGAGNGVHRGPHPVDRGVGGLAVGRRGQRALQVGVARPGRRRRHAGDARGGGEGGPQRGRRARVADDDDGLARAGREVRGEHGSRRSPNRDARGRIARWSGRWPSGRSARAPGHPGPRRW